jgi:hypothetical protein
MREQARIDPAQLQEADAVVTADGEHLGYVIAFWPDMLAPSHLVVEGGRILHHDWYVPAHAIAVYHPPRPDETERGVAFAEPRLQRHERSVTLL